jgi:hypothetical protein
MEGHCSPPIHPERQSAEQEISISIEQMGEDIEGVTIHRERNMSREDRVLEENILMDIVVIRHGG